MSCNCNHSYPTCWDFVPSIYISADAPLDANGMHLKLKLGDGVYVNENGELCSEAGSGGTGNVDDVLVNGSSVVSNRIANVDLTPYALSATVQSQVNNLENKIEVISGETQPYSAGSGINIANQVISVKGGNVLNGIEASQNASGTQLSYTADGVATPVVLGKSGFINGLRVFDNNYNSFELLSGITIAGTDATITNYKAVVPSATTSVFGVVKVDNAINSASTNPVQNKVIKAALDEKANGQYTLVALTQAEYDALAEKDENTIYMIKEA